MAWLRRVVEDRRVPGDRSRGRLDEARAAGDGDDPRRPVGVAHGGRRLSRDLGNGYELSADRARLDRAAVHAYLTTTYWALGRTRERQDELIDRKRARRRPLPRRPAGRVRPRVDCDAAHFVYLADVYVLAEHRGAGLGVELVREIVERGPFADRRWILHTRDAGTLYARLGFRHHERLMQRDPA